MWPKIYCHILYSHGVDKQGAYASPVTKMHNIFEILKQDFAFSSDMNAKDDIDIANSKLAIPCVRLSVWDTPELCQVKTAKS